ncbi:uncharacterized protein [Musca autumnalis]|uniref:uncharacterized protein n=1 Tax=Musca autumnalis TaxID=221902 RepID=UPI003CF361BA
MTSSSCFNGIFSNCDVWIRIYKLLPIQDQLRLAMTNESLKTIYLKFINRINYETLHIVAQFGEYFVSNNTCRDRFKIPTREFLLDFLQLYAKNVYELYTEAPVPTEFFKNLIKLECRMEGHLLTVADVTRLVNNLPHLETLRILAFSCESYKPTSSISRKVVKELLRFKKLKHLQLDFEDYDVKIKFKDFRQILTKLQLDSLQLQVQLIRRTNCDEESEALESAVLLKELETEVIQYPGKFLSMLSKFKHLEVLTIRLATVNEMTRGFRALSELKHLTIYETSFRKTRNRITLPPNLIKLHLRQCYDLTLNALQKLLHENSLPRLTEFVSVETYYDISWFKELQISSRIQTLKIENFNINVFHSPFVKNSTLRKLSLHWEEHQPIQLCPTGVGTLTFCHNLHTLEMHNLQLSMDILLKFENLEKLSLEVRLPDQWSYLTSILRLKSLRELTVRQNGSCSGHPSPQSFVTNVTKLKIRCLHCMETDFWFQLLILNPRLELQMRFDMHYSRMFKTSIDRDLYPRDQVKIQICGFTVDYNKLREDYFSTIASIPKHVDEYDDDDGELKCNLIISTYK